MKSEKATQLQRPLWRPHKRSREFLRFEMACSQQLGNGDVALARRARSFPHSVSGFFFSFRFP